MNVDIYQFIKNYLIYYFLDFLDFLDFFDFLFFDLDLRLLPPAPSHVGLGLPRCLNHSGTSTPVDEYTLNPG